MTSLRRIDHAAGMLARGRPSQRVTTIAATDDHLIFRLFGDTGNCMCAGFDALADRMHDLLGPFRGFMRGFVNLIAQIVLRSGKRAENKDQTDNRKKFFHNIGNLVKRQIQVYRRIAGSLVPCHTLLQFPGKASLAIHESVTLNSLKISSKTIPIMRPEGAAVYNEVVQLPICRPLWP